MPCIKDESTVNKLAEIFTSNGRNQEQAMIEAGYTPAYAKSYCGKMWDNSRLIAAIAKIDAKTSAKAEYDRTESMTRKQELYVVAKGLALAGNLDAIRTAAGLLTNMDTICGLVKTHVVQDQAEERVLSETEHELASKHVEALHLSA